MSWIGAKSSTPPHPHPHPTHPPTPGPTDGFPALEGNSEEVLGKHFEIRKIDTKPVNEGIRSAIRDFCQMLVGAINKYYAFGGCWALSSASFVLWDANCGLGRARCRMFLVWLALPPGCHVVGRRLMRWWCAGW